MLFFYISQFFLYIVLVVYLYFSQKLTDVHASIRALEVQYFCLKQVAEEKHLEKEIAKTMLNRKKYNA